MNITNEMLEAVQANPSSADLLLISSMAKEIRELRRRIGAVQWCLDGHAEYTTVLIGPTNQEWIRKGGG